MSSILLDAAQFKKMISSVKNCVSSDTNRPVLSWIKLVIVPGSMTAYACDGYRAARYVFRSEKIEETFTTYIKPLNYAINLRLINEVLISSDSNTSIVSVPTEWGSLDYTFQITRLKGERFVDIDGFFGRAKDRAVRLDARLLSGLCLCFSGTALSDSYLTMYSENDSGQPVFFHREDKDSKLDCLLLPVRMTTEKEVSEYYDVPDEE